MPDAVARSGDPTHGRIDPDIQRAVDEMEPTSLGQRVAMENTLQARRDQTWERLRDDAYDHAARPPRQHWHLFARHRHPNWHGHCRVTDDGIVRHSCGRTHWHFLWRHNHG